MRGSDHSGLPAAVDILLPFYRSNHVRETVASVLNQTRGDWRLTIVDDASPGGDVADWLQNIDDPRVRYTRNPVNLGVGGNFKRCLDLVEAPWFVMLGDDDLLLPTYVESMVDAVRRQPSVDLIQPRVGVIDGQGYAAWPVPDVIKRLIRPPSRVLRGEDMARSLARGDWAYFPSVLWRTSRVKEIGFDDSYRWALDLALLFEVALGDGSMLILDEDLFRYRRHGESASQTAARNGDRFIEEAQLLEAYASQFRAHGWELASRAAKWRIIPRMNALFSGLRLLIGGDTAGGGRCVSIAFR